MSDPRDQAFLEYWGRVIDWSDPAAEHWKTHFEQRTAECEKMVVQVEQFRSLRGLRALDVGCQTGALSVVLGARGAQVTGIDTADWLLEAARLRSKGWGTSCAFLEAKGETLPFANESFDVAFFVDVLEHCSDGDDCLAELARVLAPGGLLYVLAPNRFAPGWFVRDPHYQLAGASVLPRSLGKRYVRWRRGDECGYDVGEFPVGERVVSLLEKHGMRMLEAPMQQAERWWDARMPMALRPLRPVARAWGRVRLSFVNTFVLIAEKQRS